MSYTDPHIEPNPSILRGIPFKGKESQWHANFDFIQNFVQTENAYQIKKEAYEKKHNVAKIMGMSRKERDQQRRSEAKAKKQAAKS